MRVRPELQMPQERTVSRVLHNNVQILPDVKDERAEVFAWVAVQCLSADSRRRSPVLADMAARLVLVAT